MTKFFTTNNGDDQRKIFFKLTSQTFVIRIAGMGLYFVYQALLAQLMGVKSYGDFTVIITVVNFFVVFGLLGFDRTTLRFFSLAFAKQDWKKAKGFFQFSNRITGILSLLSVVVLFIFLWFHSEKYYKYNHNYPEAFFWGILLVPLLVFINQASAVLRALHKVGHALSSIYILLPVTVSIACIIYYKTNHYLKVDAAMFIQLCCAAAICIYIRWRVNKKIQPKFALEKAEYENKKWITASFTLFIMGALGLLIKQADILFLSHYLGNTTAGIYSAGSKLALLVPFGLSVVEFVYAPRIAELHETNQIDRLQKMLRDSTRLALLISIPVCLGLVLFGKFFLKMFGTAFVSAYLPMIIIVVGQVVNSATGMVGMLMNMTGNQKIFLIIYLCSAFLNIVLNFILIPALGMAGAAIASAVSVSALNITTYYVALKKLNLSASFL